MVACITPSYLEIVDKRTVGRKHGRLGRPLPYRHLLADGVISSDCPHRASTACSRSRPKEAASAFVHLLLPSKSPSLCERVTLCAKRRPVDVAVARFLRRMSPLPVCRTTNLRLLVVGYNVGNQRQGRTRKVSHAVEEAGAN